jgi:hypothetical protein
MVATHAVEVHAKISAETSDFHTRPASKLHMYRTIPPSFVTAVFAASVLLTGCLATAPKIAPAERQGLAPIAVTSLLGSEFHLRSIGITVFQNKSAPQSVSEWSLDTSIEATAVEAIKGAGISNVRSLPFTDRSTGDEKASMLAAAQNAGIKTLVTVTYINAENQPFLNPGSYGIYSRGNSACLYSKFFVTVWDVSERSRRKGSPQIECSRLDGWTWKPTLDEYTPDERARLQQALKSQLRAQIQGALNDTGLTGATP